MQLSVRTSVPESDVPVFQFFGIDDPNPVQWRDTFDSLTNTYPNPGDFWIYLTIQSNNQVRQDSVEISVLNSESPQFQLGSCETNGLRVEITDTFYDSYIVDFGDGTNLTVLSGSIVPSHFYPDNQTYDVTVTGRLNDAPNNCGSQMLPFTPVLQVIPPQITRVDVISNNEIELEYVLSQSSEYRLEAALNSSSAFQFLQMLSQGSSALTLNGFTAFDENYCFRISAIDPCTGNNIFSNRVCSIVSEVQAQNNQVLVSWAVQELGTGEETYVVGRNLVPNFITVPSGNFSFTDGQVICETDYTYTLSIAYAGGGVSTAPSVSTRSFSTDKPPKVENLSVDIQTDGVFISWENFPEIDSSTVRQFTPQGSLITSGGFGVSPSFLKTDLEQFPQTCYTHTYTDVCTNSSGPSNLICSIFLRGIPNDDGSITLLWNSYRGWMDSVASYSLQKFDLNGSLFETVDVGTDTVYVDQIDGTTDQIITYVVVATANDGFFGPVKSNVLPAARKARLIFPDAFTPDGDGLNDSFRPEFLFIKIYELNVYNRWGETVFNSKDPEQGWDGHIGGNPADESFYTYHATTEDFRGLKISRSGIVFLLRK